EARLHHDVPDVHRAEPAVRRGRPRRGSGADADAQLLRIGLGREGDQEYLVGGRGRLRRGPVREVPVERTARGSWRGRRPGLGITWNPLEGYRLQPFRIDVGGWMVRLYT